MPAYDPDLTPEQLWGAVYQITSYHAGGVDETVTALLASVAAEYMGTHRLLGLQSEFRRSPQAHSR